MMLPLGLPTCAATVDDVGFGNWAIWPVRVAMVQGRSVAWWASAIYVR